MWKIFFCDRDFCDVLLIKLNSDLFSLYGDELMIFRIMY